MDVKRRDVVAPMTAAAVKASGKLSEALAVALEAVRAVRRR